MEKVRMGIIGVGNMGSSHALNFDKGVIDNAVLAAICDINPDKITALQGKLQNSNPAVFNKAEDLIDSGLVDAVIVSVPHYFHPTYTIYALEHGVNALCEKPAGVYTKQVKEMNAAADKCDKLFAIMFNQRTNCVYRKMREMIANGELGEIKRVNWIISDCYRPQSYYNSSNWRATWAGEGGGVLLNQSPHQIDLLQWILGQMPKKVQACCHFGKWHDIEVDDDVTAYMEFENGATGVFITSTGDYPGSNRLEITGTLGTLLCEGDKLIFKKLNEDEREFCKNYTGGFGDPGHEVIEVETDGKNPQHIGICNNFVNAILGLEPLYVDGREGLKGVQIMDAMLMSAWKNEAVSIPINDDEYYALLQKRVATSKKKDVQEVVLDTAGTYGSKQK